MPWFPNDLLTSAARSRCRFCRSSSASCTRWPWSRQRDSGRAGRKGGEMILKWWKTMEQMERIWEKMGNMVEKDGKHMGKDAKWWEHDWKTWETDGNICVKLLCLILWKRRIYCQEVENACWWPIWKNMKGWDDCSLVDWWINDRLAVPAVLRYHATKLSSQGLPCRFKYSPSGSMGNSL